MVSGISSIGSISTSNGQTPLSPQTKAQLEKLGVDTSKILTEAQGQAALQSAQKNQSSQQSESSQQAQSSQQSNQSQQPQEGNNSSMQTIKAEAQALAEKVGASVSSNAKLSEIMDAISEAIDNMKAQATNDPKKAEKVASYQAEYQVLNQTVSNMQASMQATASGGSQLQSSLAGLANYNIASMSISNKSNI